LNDFHVPWAVYFVAYTPWLVALAGVLYLGLRAVRALERRGGAHDELEQLKERTLRLEEQLSLANEQLQRLHDGQEFTSKLLADRADRVGLT
jgi:hypothetical protein